LRSFIGGNNLSFYKLSHGYCGLVRRLVLVSALVLVVYALLIALTGWQFQRATNGFIP
jgi:HAE1 family hydrophobic/amphiphilic exporter-1